ncbi:MAG: heparinase II/III family protein [Ignavibacteriaceae bacterium]|nr:heparinase II/III family protein [Ignavibacteriaceae bacterium]
MKILFISLIFSISICGRNQHPNLLINTQDVREIRASLGKYPVFDNAYQKLKDMVDKALTIPVEVPVPRDAGGYTHERHKKNYTEMQAAGILFSVTNDDRYAAFIKDMLLKYADLYPTLGKHPAGSNETAGRLFWQSLNECVWLVHAAQAYDCIYDWLTAAEREKIETNLFRPMAKFLTEEKVEEFDRIHNHGTWTVTAVGIIGYVMGDKNLVGKALYGSRQDGTGGFIKQLDELFSPDGFYTEGPYYVRYALLPFFTFAKAINNNQPELKIFQHRNQILKKAFYSALQLTYTNGAFIPINDALKEKNFLSPEIITSLDITYGLYGEDKSLLNIAAKQSAVMISGDGLKVARDLQTIGNIPGFPYKSIEFSDGAKGDEGGVGILRFGPVYDESLLLMKYTGHGLSHGHFDKLSMLYYDQGNEILQDYGASRFLNVETKDGGRYLPETKSFARQTIAHNTVTVDGKSDYQGKESISEKNHADKHFFTVSDTDFQIMSAKVLNAYDGVYMQRTMAMINDKLFSKPIIIDVFKIISKEKHQYDLPFYYMGQLTYTNIKYNAHDKKMGSLGNNYGYQHLWNEAEGNADSTISFSWLQGNRYYTVVSDADTSIKVFFVRIGAGDPDFDLRHEPAVIMRYKGDSHVFASVIEPHGMWDGINEFSAGATGIVRIVKVLTSDDDATAVQILGNNLNWILLINNRDASDTAKHTLKVLGKEYKWSGNFSLIKKDN